LLLGWFHDDRLLWFLCLAHATLDQSEVVEVCTLVAFPMIGVVLLLPPIAFTAASFLTLCLRGCIRLGRCASE